MRILITGGTGSLGKAILRHTPFSNEEFIIFSRDEMKQYEMAKKYKAVYMLGDVRDIDRLNLAFKGVDTVIHAAALKIVPSAEFDPLEYVKTNIIGTQNVIRAAINCGVKNVVGLSTDKAVFPINLYGATKLCADKLFLAANSYSDKTGCPRFSVVRYGNVMGSRGSVIPLFLEQAKTGKLTITHKDMTRYMYRIEKAVSLIEKAIVERKAKIHIPDIKSMNIVDIADSICEFLGVKCDYEYIGIRPGEKLHESLDEDHNSKDAERLSKESFKAWLKGYVKPPQEGRINNYSFQVQKELIKVELKNIYEAIIEDIDNYEPPQEGE